jgi:hypothetical protein
MDACSSRTARRASLLWAVGVLVCALGLRVGTAVATLPIAVSVDTIEGETLQGTLLRIDPDQVLIEEEGRERLLPVAGVRRLVVDDAEPSGSVEAAVSSVVRITTSDGCWLGGEDVAWSSETLVVVRGSEKAVLPGAAVTAVEFGRLDTGEPSSWLRSVPERPDSDLLVVRRGSRQETEEAENDAFEFVPCAVTGITADAVTVQLDDETIPVRRSKVVGVYWLRDRRPPAALRVTLKDGSLGAARVSWLPEFLLLDETAKVPGRWLAEIDYAAGRTVRLSDLPTERVEVEPFFARLGRTPGLESFFAPRMVELAGQGAGALLLRPRTTVVWRIPEHGRRFRTVLAPAAEATASTAVVAIAVDDRELFRGPVDRGCGSAASAAGTPIDLDITGGRRLRVEVEFPSGGGMGGPVRMVDPCIER